MIETLRLSVLVLLLVACGAERRPDVDGGTREDAGSGDFHDAGTADAGIVPDAGPLPPPTLLEVSPVRGENSGGTWLTLRGRGFLQGVAGSTTEAARRTVLKLGSSQVQGFQIIDDTVLDLRAPPGPVGTASITLENPRGVAVCEGCFTWFEPLTLSAVTPEVGPLAGGNTVTLAGAGFTETTQVLIGGAASPGVTRVSSTELRAVVPRGRTVDRVDVRVHGGGEGSVLRRAYRYAEEVRIADLVPLTGPLAGGTQVVLTGRGFEGATGVLFGGISASTFTVESPTRITATTPPGAGLGAVDVRVHTPWDAWTARGGFTYADDSGPLALYGVFPHVGARADGTVTLTGQGLDAPGLAVSFGGELPRAPVAVTSTTAVVSVPLRGALPRVVSVTVTQGAESVSLPQGYTFRLSLASLNPLRGPVRGGTEGLLEGTSLPPDAVVHLGALEAANVSVAGETQLHFTTPAGASGPASDLRVHAAGDPENEALLPAAFTYEAPLLLGQVQPARGAIAGGTRVTLWGAGFGEGTSVTFGGVHARDVQILDAHTLTCLTPLSQPGTVEVVVERESARAVLPEGFTFFDPRGPGGLSGGPFTGTLNVTVLDSSFGAYGRPVAGARVVLGLEPTTPFQGTTDARGQLTFSDSRLAGAQMVTAFKEGYDAMTVTGLRAENLTVFLRRVGSEPNPGDPPVPPTAVITGRIRGFKPPRPLMPDEALEARVFVAQASPTGGPPFGSAGDRTADTWRLRQEGASFRVHARPGLRAVYAMLGVVKGTDFAPYLLGIRRGVAASNTRVAEGQDVVLDMHLDVTVPLTVEGPLEVSGVPALHQVYAWLELGAEGFIPHPHNWNAGTRLVSSIEGPGPSLSFPHFPRLDGASFLFLDLLRGTTAYPQSLLYHRQPGALAAGVTLGPMLPLATFTTPARGERFAGTVAWHEEGAAPSDVRRLVLSETGPTGGPRWTVVMPGGQTQVSMPAPALEVLRATLPEGAVLRAELTSSRVPRFQYDQWTYDALSPAAWTAYALARSELLEP
ncbi:IPT/TIG domain-containing protein [Hyalangium rubrum]|uniref:IPT/TIG domain-containing protein n=1 Tax=Hyalangium rubrum TaxID=3103134 RepID=A0ABU5HFR2_9BACT|nr:IPT/TIG domain-containing protein [Hyalangium sp. s54d21]MDY7232310.1 IPT/TIG domain-containing protein [Hyalangium sp. s54d21]